MKIAILGGTGKEGAGLGFRWAAAGHGIIIGSRSADRAVQAAEQLSAGLPPNRPGIGSGTITGRENLAAAQEAEVVVLAVPYEAQFLTLDTVAPGLHDKLLITVVAPLGTPKGRVWQVPGGSAAEEAQAFLNAQLGESVRVVAAFQSISAEHLQDLDRDIDSDVMVVGDKLADRQVAVDLAADAGMRGIHAGPLQNASVVEGMAAVMIAINVRYKIKDAGLRITGL